MCLIVENIVDGLKDTIQDMDKKWKMYVSLHLKRSRLEHEAEKRTIAMAESEPRETDELRPAFPETGIFRL